MAEPTMESVMNPGAVSAEDPAFPHAPSGWSRGTAEQVAKDEGLSLNDDHWEVVKALQGFASRHEEGTHMNTREVHDALDERFHSKGGIKYVYTLLPGGPVAQGCRLAGLEPPPGAEDKSFGSVV